MFSNCFKNAISIYMSDRCQIEETQERPECKSNCSKSNKVLEYGSMTVNKLLF